MSPSQNRGTFSIEIHGIAKTSEIRTFVDLAVFTSLTIKATNQIPTTLKILIQSGVECVNLVKNQ